MIKIPQPTVPMRAWMLALLIAILGVNVAEAYTDTAAVVDLNDSLKFTPAEITVKVGDTVEWRNIGRFPHTVTADPMRVGVKSNVELPQDVEPFDSGWLQGTATFRYTFTRPGVYRYVCLPHEGANMLGTVIVQ